jgi:hypothetical protein
MKKRTVDYVLHSQAERIASVFYYYFNNNTDALGWYSPQYQSSVPPPYHQEWYTAGEPTDNFPYNQWLLNFQELYSYSGTPPFDPNSSPYLLLTPNQHPGSDGILRSTLEYSKTPYLETRGTKVIYGLGPRHFFGRMDNSASYTKVKTNTWVGMSEGDNQNPERFLPFFLNQAMDYPLSRASFKLSDSRDSIVLSGSSLTNFLEEITPDSLYLDRSLAVPLTHGAGRYTLEVTDSSSWVLQRKGVARVLLGFDTRLSDKNPPSMVTLNVLADSEYADQILPGQHGEIRFRVSDQEGPLSSVALYQRPDRNDSTLWHALSFTHSSGTDEYSAVLPDTLPQGYIQLRLVSQDAAGNTLEYRAEPGFCFGVPVNHPPTAAKQTYPVTKDTVTLYNSNTKPLIFQWHRSTDIDYWDSLRYTLHLWGEGGALLDTTITSVKDTSCALKIMQKLLTAHYYFWSVQTSDGAVTVTGDTVRFRTGDIILAVSASEDNMPKVYALYQNYPNPFNPSTIVRYDIPVHKSGNSRTRLVLYDLLGREVATLVDSQNQMPGRYSIEFNAQRLASGVYFYRLQTGEFVQTKKFVLLR